MQRPPRPSRRRALLRAVAWATAFCAAIDLVGLLTSAKAADLPDLPDLIAQAKPSILPVGTFSATGNPRFSFRGTGFVVGDGTLIATNFHVLPDTATSDPAVQMAVVTSRGTAEGQARMARVVGTDRVRDLALLKIDGPPLPPLLLGAPGSTREGQSIALMGFPIGGTLGFSVVTHRGIIASITRVALPAPTARQLDPRAVSRLREGNFEVLQLDATAYPGNSGGPVLDARNGRVVGIVNQVLVRGSRESALSSPTGITYAIPTSLLVDLLADYERSHTEIAKPQ
jgi:S1-C subfamily serine protease